jgi:hypothetical protein
MIDHNMFQSISARPEHRFREPKQGVSRRTLFRAPPSCRALLYSFGEPRIWSSRAHRRSFCCAPGTSWKKSERNQPLVRALLGLEPNAQGKLRLEFVPTHDCATVSAIAIVRPINAA